MRQRNEVPVLVLYIPRYLCCVTSSFVQLIIIAIVLSSYQLQLYTNSFTITRYRYPTKTTTTITNQIYYSPVQDYCNRSRKQQNKNNTRQLQLLVRAAVSKSIQDLYNNQSQLSDRFGRWKFLQYILEEDECIDDNVNYILFTVLSRWLQKDTDIDTSNIPLLAYDIITNLLNNNIDEQNLPVVVDTCDYYINEDISCCFNLNIVQLLEQLLPDPQNDEDSYKSLWDTVIELHGREAVKINERNNSPNWKARCTIARVLLHYDFLTDAN